MTTEEHLRVMCGDKDFQIAALRGRVDELQAKITEWENQRSAATVRELNLVEK
jgi:hypothetical protein